MHSKLDFMGLKVFFDAENCFHPSILSTPVRTHSISGLKSRVMKLPFLSLKLMAKSGLEFILKLTEPLQRYLLSCQASSAILGAQIFLHWAAVTLKGPGESPNEKSIPPFIIIFK